MTYKQAIALAKRKSKRYDREYFVIWDRIDETYEVADEIDLYTFYLGIHESDIQVSSLDL